MWSDPIRAQATMRELSGLRATVDAYVKLDQRLQDARVLVDLADELDDLDSAREAAGEADAVAEAISDIGEELMFSGKHDHRDAIVIVQPGAGGVDAQDWAAMVVRMYVRWADLNALKTTEIDYVPADQAGIKNATLSVQGERAYGWLRSERGIHRLVRMSPFNAGGTRETSFARVEVYPDIQDDDITIEINPADLEIDTYRSQGAGGQNVQKNESAIRIRHIPSGLIVTCQDQRSQTQNRERALHILKVRLQEQEERQRETELRNLKGEHVEAEFGSQIRNYVLHPYQLVKDTRTGCETGNAQAVLDGGLDEFMRAYLKGERRDA